MGESPQSFLFGRFTLDTARGVLLGPDGEIRLRPKTYRVLLHLLCHHGRLLSRDELMQAAWGKAAITDDSLTQCLVEIRRALGDERSMVRTVPRRGYLFDGAVSLVHSQQPVGEEATDAPPRPAAPLARGATQPRWRWAAAAVLSVILTSLLGLAVVPAWRNSARHDGSAPIAPVVETVPNSIAVLPFVDLSAARDQDHLGEGIAEEVLNTLAQFRSLKVIARTSSFSFRDAPVDVRTIARQLGVTYVLEGSVRRSGDRVRVIAQLIDARDSTHLWSKDFDRGLDDIFTVQEEIAGNVAGILDAAQPGNTSSSRERHVAEAYEHFLRGRYLFHRRTAGDVDRARTHFERAIEIDPGYAAAWAALAGTWIVQRGDETRPEDPGLASARHAVARALELDPHLAEAHLRAAMLESKENDTAAAWRHLGIAEKLDPDNLLLLGLKASSAIAEGDLAAAIGLQQRAVSRDPLSVVTRMNLVGMLLAAGHIEEGREQIEVISELSDKHRSEVALYLAETAILEGRYAEGARLLAGLPESGARDVAIAITASTLGRTEELQAASERLRASGTWKSAVGLAEVHAQDGDLDTAAYWLEEARQRIEQDSAYALRDWRTRLWSSLYLEPLRRDPRWEALVENSPQVGANTD